MTEQQVYMNHEEWDEEAYGLQIAHLRLDVTQGLFKCIGAPREYPQKMSCLSVCLFLPQLAVKDISVSYT